MIERTDLYRYYDADDRLLYVGISFSAVMRASQHRSQKGWWNEVALMTVEHLPSREAAERAELEAIRSEEPAHNVIGKRSSHESKLCREFLPGSMPLAMVAERLAVNEHQAAVFLNELGVGTTTDSYGIERVDGDRLNDAWDKYTRQSEETRQRLYDSHSRRYEQWIFYRNLVRPRCRQTTKSGHPCRNGGHMDGLCVVHHRGMQYEVAYGGELAA